MAEEVKELLIRVSATTELLRSQLTAAERQVASFESTTTTATARVNTAFQKTGYSAAAQQAGIKQLGAQFGDLSLQLGSAAASAKPAQLALMAFAQQGGQIAQALDLATGGTSKFAAFMGGPWGIAIAGAAAALGPLIQGLIDTAMKAEKATGALDDLIKKRRQEQAERSKVRDANTDLDTLRNERTRVQDRIRLVGRVNPANGQMMNVYAEQQRLKELNKQIAEGEAAVMDELRARREETRRFVAQKASASGTTPTVRTPRIRTGSAGRAATNPLSTSFIDNLASDNSRDLFRASEERIKLLNEASADQWKAQSDATRRNAEYEYDQRVAVEERLRSVREAQLSTLSGLYEDLFRGGTKAIWDDFGRIGLRVVSQVLAKFTLARLGGGGFDLGSAISTAFTSVLGFADGGRPPIGRVSMVGERGPELFVPDVAGTIVPNHALGGGGQKIVINMPNASQETIAMVRREIMNAAPMIVAAASGQTSRVMNRRTL